MNKDLVMNTLLSPINTDKSYRLGEEVNQVVFKVATRSNKRTIKEAVEKLFNVKVANVRVVNMKGKACRFGRIEGRKKDWKKAYVSLMPGHDIKFTD